MTEKFASLLNARPMIWYLRGTDNSWACFERGILEHLLVAGRIYQRRPSNLKRVTGALRAILLNVLYEHFADPVRYVAVGMRSGCWRNGVGYKVFKRCIEGLRDNSLIELHPGFMVASKKKGFVTRIRAKVRLIEISVAHGVGPSSIFRADQRPLVELRGPKGTEPKMLAWPSDEDSQLALRGMTGNLERINAYLAKSFIGLHLPDTTLRNISAELHRKHPESSWVDFNDRRLRRIFNDGSTKLGGRFYGGWWQQIPSVYRRNVHLAAPGQLPLWTVELDFGSFHPTMLYGRVGKPAPQDCYALKGRFETDRSVRWYAKAGLLLLINAANRKSAEKALRMEVRERFDSLWYARGAETQRPPMSIPEMIPRGCPGVVELLDKLEELHKPIQQFFCSGIANELMYADSVIAEKVMLRLIDRDIPVLPVHDSFLVRKGDQSVLLKAMQEACSESAGITCRIDPDPTELDEYQAARPTWSNAGIDQLSEVIRNEERGVSTTYWTTRAEWEMSLNKSESIGGQELQDFESSGPSNQQYSVSSLRNNNETTVVNLPWEEA